MTLDLQVVIATAHCEKKGEERSRQRCLLSLLKEFKQRSMNSLVLESRADRDHLDRRYIALVIRNGQAPPYLSYDHRQPSDEPLLGLPDAFAWAYGSRRRVETCHRTGNRC